MTRRGSSRRRGRPSLARMASMPDQAETCSSSSTSQSEGSAQSAQDASLNYPGLFGQRAQLLEREVTRLRKRFLPGFAVVWFVWPRLWVRKRRLATENGFGSTPATAISMRSIQKCWNRCRKARRTRSSKKRASYLKTGERQLNDWQEWIITAEQYGSQVASQCEEGESCWMLWSRLWKGSDLRLPFRLGVLSGSRRPRTRCRAQGNQAYLQTLFPMSLQLLVFLAPTRLRLRVIVVVRKVTLSSSAQSSLLVLSMQGWWQVFSFLSLFTNYFWLKNILILDSEVLF